MFRRLMAAVLTVAMLCAPVAAQAARVSPMIVDLKPSGGGSVARVELSNPGERDIPFEVRMMRGEIGEHGELTLTPADDDFLIFPAQTIVQANSQQVFRVQYVGDPDLARSQIYYMSIQQVPVKFDPGKSQVQVVINYNVLVNLVPDGTAPQATVASIEATTRLPDPVDEDEPQPAAAGNGAEQAPAPKKADPVPQPGVVVRLSNTGTRYFMAGTSNWTITGKTADGADYSRTYKDQEMTRVIGVGVVAPDHTRAFFVPTDTLLAQESIRVEVSP